MSVGKLKKEVLLMGMKVKADWSTLYRVVARRTHLHGAGRREVVVS
jgi:hypothetical protein